MFNLIIYKPDGSIYWKDYFNTRAESEKWLAVEQTRDYWNKDFTHELIDNSQSKQELEQREEAKILREQERKAKRNAIRGIKNANNIAQLKAGLIELIKYLDIGEQEE